MAEPGSLSFPDGPRSDLEEAIASLLTQSERVLRAQGRLRALLRATQAVVEQSDLGLVLRSIVEGATELVGAQYGAMGVINPERDALEQFIYVGLGEQEAAAIGHLPEGRGLLGALITDPHPIRLARIADDPRTSGFPPHHPPMESFLGVPVRVRGEVFGNLYLTNHRNGTFSDEDVQLVEALAATAGFAIENARLLTDAETGARWVTAAAELSAAITSNSTDTALDLLVTRVRDVAHADQLAVLLLNPHDGQFRVAAATGRAESTLRGTTLDPAAVFAGAVLEDAGPHSQPKKPYSAHDPLLISRNGVSGPVMAVPLRTRAQFWGVLCIARDPDALRFSSAEIDGAADLASRASIALELARAGEEARRAMLADDRRRIARDLHDHVIQQLFGAGLGLQALAGRLGPGPDADSLGETIDQLDDAIAQIRTVIFALSHRDEASVRHRLLDVISETSGVTRRPPAIRFSGPVDLTVRDDLATDVVAVARELLSNAARHGHADHISLEVGVSDGAVSVEVQDDGVGIAPDSPRSGLNNLRDRATNRHGSFIVESTDGGTTARWTAMVASSDPPVSSSETVSEEKA
ncbi:GAF domain-containing protein [Microbacterium pumilum]|uniref:GAF domain-containing protein n=1 Tax=Microbacterium pumilum TaxID=344165 RepID=A0ABP5D4K6_9MICO